MSTHSLVEYGNLYLTLEKWHEKYAECSPIGSFSSVTLILVKYYYKTSQSQSRFVILDVSLVPCKDITLNDRSQDRYNVGSHYLKGRQLKVDIHIHNTYLDR